MPASTAAQEPWGHSVARAHERVRDAILTGEFPPGDEISQVAVAKRLGVSRTPLREALRMLVNEGLLVDAPNHKMRVAALSLADMEQLYVKRLALEAIGIRLTLYRLSDDEIDEMRELHSKMVASIQEENYASWEESHRALHRAFVRHAGDLLFDDINRLSQHAERYRRLYPNYAWRIGNAEHAQIIDACARRDGDDAARALVLHLGHMALTVMRTVSSDYVAKSLQRTLAACAAPALPTAAVSAIGVDGEPGPDSGQSGAHAPEGRTPEGAG
jgi:DNA-binding GntR family transcriptional regulator